MIRRGNLFPEGVPDLASGLYLVSTPIGNLGDITLRALDTLRAAAAIICEDTRVTKVLLNHYAIVKPLIVYHDRSPARVRPRIIQRLRQGEAFALVSDSGTPLISDPGYKLVRECLEQDIKVTAIPGANAALAGLCLSGIPPDRFLFVGFLPIKGRDAAIEALKKYDCTVILYESIRRVSGLLQDLYRLLGDRDIAVGRELTKLYEDVQRGRLKNFAQETPLFPILKGEVVVILGPGIGGYDASALDTELRTAFMEGKSPRQAVSELALRYPESKKALYRRALRQRRYRLGKWGEFLARWFFRLKGYRVIATNVTTSYGEIDLIVRRGLTLAVVEVKTRADRAAFADEVVSARQRRRLVQATSIFLGRRTEFKDYTIRFDVLFFGSRRWPEYIPNAFDGSEGPYS